MLTENSTSEERRPYHSPELNIHGDVETITLGEELGEELDGSFSTSMAVRGSKKPKKSASFS